jgi:NodT family efflux transporter outer membrane factor (OMF) lipoprotein
MTISSFEQTLAWNRKPARVLSLAGVLAALLLSGCMVGPNFKTPAPPQVSDYTAQPLTTTAATPRVTGGEAQRFVSEAEIPADWWTLFHSQPLNDLIEASLANNHDLKAAQAALLVAHENVLAQRGVYYPIVTAGYSATRQRQSGALAPTPSTNALEYSLFTPQLSVAYTPDVFGLNRRGTESIKAQEQSVRYQMIATYLTLTSNVAAAAIQDASLRDQIAATRELIAINSKILQTLQYQMAKGYASRLDVAAQESQLAQAEATLPPLLKASAQQHDLLAALAGAYPSQTAAEKFDLSSLTLPRDLPVSLPSSLVAQRPDVLQAEANLHVASANVGVAAANRLPNIQLTGSAGSSALAFGQTFGPGTAFWALGAELTAPIFDGGTLKHQESAAKATYVQASEQYRSTVVVAVQNVADTLVALDQDAEGLKAAAKAADAAKLTLDLSQRQWRDGYASYMTLLSAQQAYQQARITLIQAQAARYADTVALFQALGGGWWRRTELAAADSPKADSPKDRDAH